MNRGGHPGLNRPCLELKCLDRCAVNLVGELDFAAGWRACRDDEEDSSDCEVDCAENGCRGNGAPEEGEERVEKTEPE
jgi:hypothetical protein